MTETYSVTAPDGEEYEIEAPDGTSPEDALAHFQKHYTGPLAPEAAEGSRGAAQPADHDLIGQFIDQMREGTGLSREDWKAQLGAAPFAGGFGPATAAVGKIPYLGKLLSGSLGYGRAGEALPGAAARVARFASQGAAGANVGLQQGALDYRFQDPEHPVDLENALLEGTGTGAIGGAVLGTGSNALMNAWKGPVLSPERERLAKLLMDSGIDLRGRQVEGAAPYTEKQAEQYTRAVARQFGEELAPGEGLTQDVMGRAENRIQGAFKDAADSNGFYGDDELLGKLGEIEADIGSPQKAAVLGEDRQKVQDEIDRIRQVTGAEFDDESGSWRPRAKTVDFAAKPEAPAERGGPEAPVTMIGSGDPAGGTVALRGEAAPEDLIRTGESGGAPRSGGEIYNMLTERGSQLSELQRHPRGTVKDYAGSIRDALDDALERGSGEEGVQQIQEARRHFRNFRAVEPLTAKNDTGTVNPKAVLGRAQTFYRDIARHGTPDSDLADLGRGANAFFTKQDTNIYPPYGIDLPLVKRWGYNLLKDVGAGGAIAAAGTHLGQSPTGIALGATMAGGALANQIRRESTGYARSLIRRAAAARAVPSGLQPGLNPLTQAVTAILAKDSGQQDEDEDQ